MSYSVAILNIVGRRVYQSGIRSSGPKKKKKKSRKGLWRITGYAVDTRRPRPFCEGDRGAEPVVAWESGHGMALSRSVWRVSGKSQGTLRSEPRREG